MLCLFPGITNAKAFQRNEILSILEKYRLQISRCSETIINPNGAGKIDVDRVIA